MRKILLYSKEFVLRYYRLWKLSDLSFSRKISFSLSVPISIIRSLLLRKKYVSYLGKKFYYDDLSLPFTLLTYPYEVSSHILSHIKSGSVLTNILDIGGNIGQFAATVAALSNAKRIDVFEPNPEIFDILEQNTENYLQINLHQFGVGKPGTFSFFFRQNKSATGSLIKMNSDKTIDSDIKEISIKVTNDVKKATTIYSYDLVKIDVEGSEFEVIKNLSGIKTKYLYLEISADRDKPYSTSEIYDLIKSQFGKFEIIYQDELYSSSPCFNVLLYFPTNNLNRERK